MTTMRITINRKTKAQLEYIATIAGKRTAELAEDYLKRKASEEFESTLRNGTGPEVAERVIKAKQGRRGQPVLYGGKDPRLDSGAVYKSYAQVLRLVRPDLEQLLYNPKRHRGDNAKNILKHYEPVIFQDLRPFGPSDKEEDSIEKARMVPTGS